MKFTEAQFRVVGNSAGHSFNTGDIVKSLRDKQDPGYYCLVSNVDKYYRCNPADLEIIEKSEMAEVEDPNTVKIRMLRNQALILTRIDCSKLDENKVARLVRFYDELRKDKMDNRIAIKAVAGLAKVI